MTKKEKADRKRERCEMSEHTPDQKAKERFQRKPYACAKMIQAQAEQIHETPAEYMAGKFNIRGDADGQEHTE